MTTVNHILFPNDGSENSKKALTYVKDMAEKFQAKVTVLNAYDISIMLDNYEINTAIYGQVLESLQENSLSILEDSKKELENLCSSVETVSLQEKASQAIIDIANQKNCDLIIMSSQGLGTIKGLFFGSISNYVLHHSSIPLLILH